jgi:hypothetical protein
LEDETVGGIGSGRTGGRPVVEDCLRLDLAHLLAACQLRPGQHVSGSFKWTDARDGRVLATIGYEANLLDPAEAWMRLRYTTTGPGTRIRRWRDYRIWLTTTVPPHGGLRWWFVCPLSGRRARVLYLADEAPTFASQRALRLGYRSQRATRADRIIDKSRALRRKLGIDEGNLLELPDFPKPKGMRWHTYRRVMAEAAALVEQLWAAAPV